MYKIGYAILFQIIAIVHVYGQSESERWSEVKDKGRGTLVVAYSENSPFIYNDKTGELAGIEYEILQDFVSYLKDERNVDLDLKFEHLYNFESLIDTLKTSQRSLIGIASISTLEERKKDFNITRPYMPDIEIIISSGVFKSVTSLADFAKMVKNNRAITVSNSTFERNILELKRDYFPEIELEYVRHVDILIEEISNSDNAWGYISLPNYISYYKDGKDISRQRFFTVENLGLSLATPLNSDWDEILNEYIETKRFKVLLEELIKKHLGPVFSKVVYSISNLNTDSQPDIVANREVGVLTLERELQDLKLKQSELEIERKNLIISLTVTGIVLALAALIVLYRLVRLKIITNKKLSEKNNQIKIQNLTLNSLNKEKNELIGIVAHDLKNPLTSALTVSELFGEEELTEDQHEYISVIQRSLNRMNDLVAKILEIKILESSSLSLNNTQVDLKNAVEQVISALQIQFDNKNLIVVTDLEEISAVIDHGLLVQILDNLISNAIKFSDRNSKVTIALKEEDHKFRFEIEDEGPGIMEEDMPQLFKKFSKLKARPTQGESSTGLGLSIVKKYVEAMNGKVWCESEYGRGSNFIVEFKKIR